MSSPFSQKYVFFVVYTEKINGIFFRKHALWTPFEKCAFLGTLLCKWTATENAFKNKSVCNWTYENLWVPIIFVQYVFHTSPANIQRASVAAVSEELTLVPLPFTITLFSLYLSKNVLLPDSLCLGSPHSLGIFPPFHGFIQVGHRKEWGL